jgi:hypothetical protein
MKIKKSNTKWSFDKIEMKIKKSNTKWNEDSL